MPFFEDDDDSQHKYKRLQHPEKRQTQQHMLLVVIFFITGSIFYQIALEGGTNEQWIQDNLFKLSILLLICIGFYTTSMCILVESKIPTKTRLIMAAAMLLTLLLIIMQDTGATVEKHGLYNALCFFIVSIPTAITSILVCVCWKNMSRRRFAILNGGILFSTLFTILARLAWVQSSWSKGLWETEFQPLHPGCNIDIPTANWGEVFPYRGMNFWTGSQICPGHGDSVVKIEPKTGLLTIHGCKHTDKITVTSLPSTLNMTVDEKWWAATFQSNIFSRLEKTEIKPDKHADSQFQLKKETEAVYVQCGDHKNLLMRSVRKEEVVTRVTEQNRKKPKKPDLNVLILYFDAISRRHFFRRFPRTRLFLETMHLSHHDQDILLAKQKAQSNLKYVHFKNAPHANFVSENPAGASVFQYWRYHAIETTTMMNTRALFAGTIDMNILHTVPPLWETYREKGFATLALDNSCQDYGAKYQKRVAQADHEVIAPFCLPESHPVDKPYGTFDGPFSIRRRCMAGRYVHSYVFDYVQQFWDSYRDVPKFAIASLNEGHEGTGDVIGLVDDDFFDFLMNMRNNGDFNNTAVWIISDHGLHMGLFWMLDVYSAGAENKLPMLYSIFPNWWLKQNPTMHANLKENQDNLFTGFDLYETWQQLATHPQQRLPPRESWTHSLFDVIPFDRTCDDARIREDKCYCRT